MCSLTLCKASTGPFHSVSTIELLHEYHVTFLFQSVQSTDVLSSIHGFDKGTSREF